MALRTVRVDSSSDPALKRMLYDVFEPANRHGRVDPPPFSYGKFEASMNPRPDQRFLGFLGLEDDEPVGVGALFLPQLDNTELAHIAVVVHPDRRRQGIGTGLYYEVERAARADGRRILVAEILAPPVEIDAAPGGRFATRHGFALANTHVQRSLRLPVVEARLRTLEAKAAETASAYDIQSWTDVCPQAHLEQYARLRASPSTDAPQGEIAMQPEVWDAQRVRDRERHNRDTGTTTYASVAIAPDGTLAGHTLIAVMQEHLGLALQVDTLVEREHRGHRLGLAVKVANLRALQAGHPDVHAIRTGNADVNAAMVAVNHDLGFEPVEIDQTWQRIL